MSVDIDTGPFCGCTGCTESADVKIDHPEYGQRTVCEGHIEDYDVVAEVSA